MKKLILILITLLKGGSLLAQETIYLNYQKAVEIALENSIDLNQNRNNLEVFKVQKNETRMQYTPRVGASMRASQSEGRFFDETKGEIVDQQFRNFSASIRGELDLFTGFARIHNSKSATYAFEASQKELERTKQDVILSVAQQYLQTLLDQQLLNIALENLKAQKALLGQIEGFYKEGTGNVVDKYEQEALVQSQEVAVIRAENAYENDLAVLGEILMLEPGITIKIENENFQVTEELLQNVTLDELYNIAINNRPDLEQLEKQEISDEHFFKATRSGFMPTLSLNGSYGSGYSSNIVEVTDQTTGQIIQADFAYQVFTLNPQNSIGLTLNIPIWNQFANVRQQVTAKVNYKNTQLRRAGLKRLIFTEVQTAYNDYKAAKKNYFASQSQVESAEKALQMQKDRYREGLSNLVEVTQSNQNYVQAASNQAQANFTLIFQEIILDYFTGTL